MPWNPPEDDLLGKSYDLKSAYKQLPLRPDMKDVAHFVVWDPHNERPQIFKTNRLPFGAVASVLHFLRCSRSLWFLICRMGKIMSTSYFDDFVIFSPRRTCVYAANFAELVFLCTGWTFDMDGKKSSEFSQQVQGLGRAVDLNPKRGSPLGQHREAQTRSRRSDVDHAPTWKGQSC